MGKPEFQPELHPNCTSSSRNCPSDALHIDYVHEGKKPISCSACGKNFKTENDLKNHNVSVHESLNCGPCDKNFNVIAINVCGIECNGRLEEIRLLLVKYSVDVAILSETETSHSYASTTSIDGFKAFCPPKYVTGPPGKEVGVIVLVSEKLASSCKIRPAVNGSDTVQTVWIQLTNHGILIGGVYQRGRSSNSDLEKLECIQLNNQILKAAQSGLGILLMGDTNMDHSNPNHRRKNEARELLSIIEAANMRRLPTGPTWKSFGLHKVCTCKFKSQALSVNSMFESKTVCECPKRHKVSN